jgi:ribosomal protein L17
MPRITLALGDREHLALKLLALRKRKKFLALLQEAVAQYLEREGGYSLKIESDENDE